MRTCKAESQKRSAKGSNLKKTTVLWPSMSYITLCFQTFEFGFPVSDGWWCWLPSVSTLRGTCSPPASGPSHHRSLSTQGQAIPEVWLSTLSTEFKYSSTLHASYQPRPHCTTSHWVHEVKQYLKSGWVHWVQNSSTVVLYMRATSLVPIARSLSTWSQAIPEVWLSTLSTQFKYSTVQ